VQEVFKAVSVERKVPCAPYRLRIVQGWGRFVSTQASQLVILSGRFAAALDIPSNHPHEGQSRTVLLNAARFATVFQLAQVEIPPFLKTSRRWWKSVRYARQQVKGLDVVQRIRRRAQEIFPRLLVRNRLGHFCKRTL
jgi:hypothetical protein